MDKKALISAMIEVKLDLMILSCPWNPLWKNKRSMKMSYSHIEYQSKLSHKSVTTLIFKNSRDHLGLIEPPMPLVKVLEALK